MPRCDVALGDCKQAGETRFRGEQIVATRVEEVVGKRIADRQQFSLRIEEKRKIHCQRHLAGGSRKRPQPVRKAGW